MFIKNQHLNQNTLTLKRFHPRTKKASLLLLIGSPGHKIYQIKICFVVAIGLGPIATLSILSVMTFTSIQGQRKVINLGS